MRRPQISPWVAPGLSLFLQLCCVEKTFALNVSSRWAQAVAVVEDALFIYGGKSDDSNAFSYTQAPWTNDILFLSLSDPFDPSSPSWSIVGGSDNASAQAQGPALAWHTLSAYSSSSLLSFGGNTGPLSDIVTLTSNDSALSLDVFDRLQPTLTPQANDWAGEPQRRMRHAAASVGGKVYIFGGEKADGSNNACADHYVFDPAGPSFALLPTANGPTDIYGHVALVLNDGNIVVFGGVSQSLGGLLAFDKIWILNVSANPPSWGLISVDCSNLPLPRVAFCAVVLQDGRILIQGGSDASFLANFEDGWILDLSKSPAMWTPVEALSLLGPRRDHFAVAVGTQVVFGFGFADNGPADAQLHVYDTGSSTFVPTFTPMTEPPAHTTLPPSPSQTGSPGSGSGSGSNSGAQSTGTNGGGGSGGTGTVTGVHPTNTVGGGGDDGDGNGGGNGGGGSGTGAGNGNTNGGGTGPSDSNPGSKKTTAIAVGSILGVLALVAGAGATTYYMRRRRASTESAFSPLGTDDDPESGHPIPIVGARSTYHEKGPRALLATPLAALGIIPGHTRQPHERRDMLADEDRSFDWEHVSRHGSGRSNWSGSRTGSAGSASIRSRLSTIVSGGLAALGVSTSRRRQPTDNSADWEKFYGAGGDPFSDEIALMAEGRPDRPRGGHAYTDPFEDVDADPEVLHDVGPEDAAEGASMYGGVKTRPPHPAIRTALPPMADFVPMSPLIEQASRNSISSNSQAHSSSGHSNTLSNPTSSLSHGPHSPRPSSILDPAASPTMRRSNSNSWWARLAETPRSIARRASDASTGRSRPTSAGFVDDFRDPTPHPRLLTIDESTHSHSPESPESAAATQNRHNSKTSSRKQSSGDSTTAPQPKLAFGFGRHGRSVSSLQTANSETLAHAGAMEVVQREGTYDSQVTTSPTSVDEFGVAGPSSLAPGSSGSRPRPLVVRSQPSEASQAPSFGTFESEAEAEAGTPEGRGTPWSENAPSLETPLATTVGHSLQPSATTPVLEVPPPVVPMGPRAVGESGGAVMARARAYERRMSRDIEGPPPPTNTRRREERAGAPAPVVRYGLAPRPSLFVANPDNRSTDGL
ncbi:hypothetical protein OF83DRAFT_16372 [Amylostereum chailletii]|nr:hypothetical protein OF83DRAFT_16372 [Amylostereum chailletii]